jgi:hypothetical protein
MNLTGKAGIIAEPWIDLHDRIKPTSKLCKVKPSKNINASILTSSKSSTSKIKKLESITFVPNQPKVSVGIDKNSILSKYQDSCIKKGFENQATSIAKGEIPPTPLYPLHHRLIADCKMKPSSNLYYQVRDLRLNNVMIFLVKSYELFFTESKLVNLKCVNKKYHKMIDDVL